MEWMVASICFTIFTTGLLNIACFILGYKCNSNGKDIKVIPEIKGPLKAIAEYKETKEEKKRIEETKKLLENIDNYDGTSNGQKDI